MDEDNCMVDIARFFLEFTVEGILQRKMSSLSHRDQEDAGPFK